MTNWTTVEQSYNIGYGETVEQLDGDIFLKNVDGKFQVVDYKNTRVSPEFDWGKDAEQWYSDNK